jgi:hypothetical protein
MKDRKKTELVRKDSFIASEPRYIERKESVTITKFSIFPPKPSDEYINNQLSHAIYDIEIANSNALMMSKKQ